MVIIFYTDAHSFYKQMLNEYPIEMLSKQFHVELWSLKKLTNHDYLLPDEIDYINIDSIIDFRNRINSFGSKKIVIINLSNDEFFFKMMSLINLRNIIMIKYKKDLIHDETHKSEFKILILRYAPFIYSFLRLKWRFKNKVKYLKYDYFINSFHYKQVKAKVFIRNHHKSYDEILKNNNRDNIIKSGKYILFIDGYEAFHPGIKKENKLSVKSYFSKVNKFLSRVEEKYGIPVIIAAYPKSDSKYNYLYDDRQIIKHETDLLIKFSEFCMGFVTTSIYNAIIYNKPIIFLTYNEFEKKLFDNQVKFSKFLRATLYDLDTNVEINSNFHKKYYDKFIKKYLLNTKELSKTNEEIFNDLFLRISDH